MRAIFLALSVLGLTTGAARAQIPANAAAKPHPKFTMETPILQLMEDPRTLAFLDKHLPGLSERMRDPEVANLFANTSLDHMSKDPDHGRALTPSVMTKLAAGLEEAQAQPQPAP